jgi:serine/threonine protein kinase/WD40 repeat protein
MNVTVGTRLLHYELAGKIGEGGMGVVWQARDTQLNRDVAIKILPPELAQEPDRLARFEREARLLASLNHQNIAAIYGLHQADGVFFLAMELCAGEDLSARLSRGPLPVDDAVRIAGQLAIALTAAHTNGVVHRDLKPANIQISPGGDIKVLDFGLAKAMTPDPMSGDPRSSLSPTITSAGTVAGVILGTAAYMSPEQARGIAVDERADIWAFGCVVYEMLTGNRCFPGQSISDSIAAILKTEPDWDALPAATSLQARRMLKRCLAKDADKRLHSAADARLELEELAYPEDAPHEASTARHSPFALLAWGGLALVAGLAIGAISLPLLSSKQPAAATTPVHLQMTLPPSAALAAGSFVSSLALSPSGQHLVYVGVDEGIRRLYVRDLQSPQVMALPGTEGAEGPFFSPDGQWVGFFADWKLKRTSMNIGGLPRTICELTDFRGASWGADDVIVLAPSQSGPLQKISADGGVLEPITEITDNAFTHRLPQFLPDGRTFIFASYTSAANSGFNFEDSTLWLHSMETGVTKRLMESGSQPRYSPSGHILYNQSGSLLAAPFDTEALEITGPPRPVISDVAVQINTGATQFDVSPDGTLVYVTGGVLGDDTHLELIDRQGQATIVEDLEGIGRYPRFSPDGSKFIIFQIGANRGGVWLGELGASGRTRLAPGGPGMWSHDGRQIVYLYGSVQGLSQLYLMDTDGHDSAQLISPDTQNVSSPTEFSPDGKVATYVVNSPETGNDLWIVPLDGGEPEPFLATPDNETGMHFSPDGDHVVYVSDTSGRYEIYVSTYPDGQGSWQISTGGGHEPIWSADGNEIFYRSGDNMMTVQVQSEPGFRHEVPAILFRNYYDGQLGTAGLPNYDVSKDGQQFLMTRSAELNLQTTEVQVILNWADSLLDHK